MPTFSGQKRKNNFWLRQHMGKGTKDQSNCLITPSCDQAISICRQTVKMLLLPSASWYYAIRVILIQKSFLDQIAHVPKLFSLLHWSQNIFCFLCSSTPSHGGSIFRLQWEFQWENDQNKKNGQKSLFRGPKWFPMCLNRGFRVGICIEKWS